MEATLTPQASRILDCAQSLISDGGYHGFSYADISAQVGITKASIHHHFPKKEDLVRTLVQRYRLAAAEGLAALFASVPEPAECLQRYVGWWAACIADGTAPICICAMLSAETPALPSRVVEQVRLHFASLAHWLEGVLTKGHATHSLQLQATPAAEAQAFLASVHGAMLSARAYGDAAVFESITRAALERMQSRPPRKTPTSKAK